jgi:hypothetical protein
MSAISVPRRPASADGSEISRLDGEMVELALLLPSWQAAALEVAAQDQGLTAGQVLRHLVRNFCDAFPAFGPLPPNRQSPRCGGPGA